MARIKLLKVPLSLVFIVNNVKYLSLLLLIFFPNIYIYIFFNIFLIPSSRFQIDQNGNIWVLSDRLPTFMYARLDPEDYNFRILMGSAKEAIRDTVCSTNPSENSPTTTVPSEMFKNSSCTNEIRSIFVFAIALVVFLTRTSIWKVLLNLNPFNHDWIYLYSIYFSRLFPSLILRGIFRKM